MPSDGVGETHKVAFDFETAAELRAKPSIGVERAKRTEAERHRPFHLALGALADDALVIENAWQREVPACAGLFDERGVALVGKGVVEDVVVVAFRTFHTDVEDTVVAHDKHVLGAADIGKRVGRSLGLAGKGETGREEEKKRGFHKAR